MSPRSRLAAVVIALSGIPAAATAQARSGQIGAGLATQVVGSDPVFWGFGPAGSVRLGRETRVRALALLGAAGSGFAARGELMLELLLAPMAPGRRRGWAPFLGGGVAALGGDGVDGFLLLSVGLEQNTARNQGWRIEAGVGGGVRLGLGYRVRIRRARSVTQNGPTL